MWTTSMAGTARGLWNSIIFYSFVMGCLLMALPPRAHSQGNESGEHLSTSRQFSAVAHNTVAHQFILFGGVNNGDAGPFLNDTWVWSEQGWKEKRPATRPDPRYEAAMAYDSARQEVVLFGGMEKQGRRTVSTPWAILETIPSPSGPVRIVNYRDTWVWDGANWKQRIPAQAPSARSEHAMAYDAARKQVVLFGGISAEGKLLNDTWVWDGMNWKKMNPANIPPARYRQAMAYDLNHRQIVMFGGMDSSGFKIGRYAFNDTWLWDGTNWTKAEPVGDLPEARGDAAMDFDHSQGRLVLISGYVYSSTGTGSPRDESWAWDGSSWRKLAPSEFKLIFNAAGSGSFHPGDAERAVVANVVSPIVWISKPANWQSSGRD